MCAEDKAQEAFHPDGTSHPKRQFSTAFIWRGDDSRGKLTTSFDSYPTTPYQQFGVVIRISHSCTLSAMKSNIMQRPGIDSRSEDIGE
jgi:hypothetical protein